MIGRNKVQPAIDAPTLQYANGKSLARSTIGSGRFAPLVGFHVEDGRDEDLDRVMLAAHVPQIEIKHQRQGGAEIVRHWSLGETVRLYPVTSGPVAPTIGSSLAGRNARLTAEAGIGLRWGQGERSKMAIRAYVDVLVRAGYVRPLQLSVRSRMTDVLLACLLDHGRVCEIADGLVDRTRHPAVVAFHEIGLDLGPDEEQEWGKGDTATVVPFKSLHPINIDADYLRGRWRLDAIHAAAYRDWDGTQRWADEYQTLTEEQDRTPPPIDEPAPLAVEEPAPLAVEEPAPADEPGLFDEEPAPRRQTADEAMAAGTVGTRRRRPTP